MLCFRFPFPFGALAPGSRMKGQSDPLGQDPFDNQDRQAPLLLLVPLLRESHPAPPAAMANPSMGVATSAPPLRDAPAGHKRASEDLSVHARTEKLSNFGPRSHARESSREARHTHTQRKQRTEGERGEHSLALREAETDWKVNKERSCPRCTMRRTLERHVPRTCSATWSLIVGGSCNS